MTSVPALWIIASALSFAFTAVPARAETDLYFHWGDVGGNRDLLEAGGVKAPPGRSHFEGLGVTGDATLNPAVIQRTRDWYVKSGEKDAAGAGFYMSSDFFDSRSYGNDLLIVEVTHDPAHPYVTARGSGAMKRASREAWAKGDFSGLPLVDRYYGELNWHVMARAPTAEEAKHVQVRFRAPKPEDVPKIWDQIVKGSHGDRVEEKVYQRLFQELAPALEAPSPGSATPTRSVDIVYRRLIFDHGADYLISHFESGRFGANELGMADTMLALFERHAPGHSRNARLAGTVVKRILEKEGGLTLDHPTALKFVSAALKHLEAATQLEVVNFYAQRLGDPKLRGMVDRLLPIFVARFADLTPESRAKVRKFVLDEIRNQDLGFSEMNVQRPNLERILGAEVGRAQAEAAYLRRVDRLARIYGKNYNNNPQVRPTEMQAPDASDALAVEAWAMREALERDAASVSERLIAGMLDRVLAVRPEIFEGRQYEVVLGLYPHLHTPEVRARYVARMAALAEKAEQRNARALEGGVNRWEQDPKVGPALLKLARQHGIAGVSEADLQGDLFGLYMKVLDRKDVQGDHAKRRSWELRVRRAIDSVHPRDVTWVDGGFSEFLRQETKRPGMTADRYGKMVERLIRDFPGARAEIAKSLESTAQYDYSRLPIEWSRLIQLAAHTDPQARAQAWARETAGRTRGYHVQRGEPDPAPNAKARADLEASLLRMIQPIPGEVEYSRISRAFALVDPVYVSEDIRRLGASRPYERFNETLHVDGKTITQPAWENFEESWRKLSGAAYTYSMHRPGNPSPFGGELGAAAEALLHTQVDGSPLGNGDPFWDRQKYQTRISDAEWKAWALDPAQDHLRPFFDIEKIDGGYGLRFKDVDGLRKSFPGLYAGMDRRAYPDHVIRDFILDQVSGLKDPIQRAARILYLVPRLHPQENGNGRLARLWASVELMKGGYPPPVGFPTNDFPLNQRQIELEVRKAVKLGQFWDRMIKDAVKRGVPADRFFQDVFKGSDLEGLIHVDPVHPGELAAYVKWLEAQDHPPAWGRKVAAEVDARVQEINRSGQTLAKLSEIERAHLTQQAWEKVRSAENGRPDSNLPPFGPEAQALTHRTDKRCLVRVLGAIPHQ